MIDAAVGRHPESQFVQQEGEGGKEGQTEKREGRMVLSQWREMQSWGINKQANQAEADTRTSSLPPTLIGE
jgi:hypothetical protein